VRVCAWIIRARWRVIDHLADDGLGAAHGA
jgi:hypothetical protein